MAAFSPAPGPDTEAASQQSSSRQFWNRLAGIYGPFMAPSQSLYRQICDRIAPHLGPEMNVLELACGTGQLSFPLSPRVRLWEATDYAPAMIEQAKRQPGSSRLHFSVQDATALPYAPESFDAVVISNALHIMPEPELALGEIRRVLKADGLLFAPTFTWGTGLGARLRIGLMGLFGFRVCHRWSEGAFLAFLEANGFSPVETALLGGGLSPLCYAAAKKSDP